ncbi:MAG: 3-dehydroquinate synthase [Sphingomonadales bacterium]|nr:3-dehydroquinate synthase [Sphingomonadales bacterium]MDE2567392.1 3-dehydroquinate synthase [Sphingomonadales bacterium]
MAVIPVGIFGAPYDVRIERGLLRNAGEACRPFLRKPLALIVSDERVAECWRRIVDAAFAAERIETRWHIVPPGESSKNWARLEGLVDWLLHNEVERGDAIVALGGGVVGDLTGFAASITKRGCRFVQIPTTLLAQVDSSVGGKTAINTRMGKNLVGTFHQPCAVLIDPDALDTLPLREVRAGYAEVIKYGLINDRAFFEWCEANGLALLRGDPTAREHAIAASVKAKARIVSTDERETTGTRALLNLGHTFGHALEAETGFSDKLLHGEGVALGMVLAARFSVRQGLMKGQEAERVAAHVAASGLPASLHALNLTCDGRSLVDHMLHDKKMDAGTLPFLLMRGIGETFVARDVNLELVADFLDQQLRG